MNVFKILKNLINCVSDVGFRGENILLFVEGYLMGGISVYDLWSLMAKSYLVYAYVHYSKYLFLNFKNKNDCTYLHFSNTWYKYQTSTFWQKRNWKREYLNKFKYVTYLETK